MGLWRHIEGFQLSDSLPSPLYLGCMWSDYFSVTANFFSPEVAAVNKDLMAEWRSLCLMHNIVCHSELQNGSFTETAVNMVAHFKITGGRQGTYNRLIEPHAIQTAHYAWIKLSINILEAKCSECKFWFGLSNQLGGGVKDGNLATPLERGFHLRWVWGGGGGMTRPLELFLTSS